MKKIFDILVFTILLFIYLPTVSNGDDIPLVSLVPNSKEIPTKASLAWVELYPEKSVLRPGETVKITLKNFHYDSKPLKNQNDTFIVKVSDGLILDGKAARTKEGPYEGGKGDMKIFNRWAGEDTMEIYYRASLSPLDKTVSIDVYDSAYYDMDTATADEVNHEYYHTPYIDNPENFRADPYWLPYGFKQHHTPGSIEWLQGLGTHIASETLKIKSGTYFLLNYEEEKKRVYGTEVYTHNIKSTIRIDCEPWQTSNMLRVKNLVVLEFSGKADRKGTTFHETKTATSATPFASNRLVLLQLDPKSENIQGIIYEPVHLNVAWEGDEIGNGPPDVVNVGPVSKDKRGSEVARFQGYKMKFDFPKSRQDFKGRTPQEIRDRQKTFLQNFTGTQVHPDYVVKKGNGKTYLGGQGEWEKKSSGSSFHHKTFTWELYITD